MSDDDRRDEIEPGDTGATGRAPRPTPPPSDKEFDELDSSFADPIGTPPERPAFFEEDDGFDDVFAPDPPPEPAPVEDFGFDDIARGDEPAPGSRRSSRRGGLRQGGASGGASPRRGRGSASAKPKGSGPRAPRLSRGSGGGGRSRAGGSGPRGGSGSRGGAASVMSDPRARLAIIAGIALLLLVVLVLWWRDHQRSQLENSYKSYVNEAGQIAGTSAGEGKRLMTLLQNTDNKTPAALATEVQKLATEANGLTKKAADLSPPGGLADADRSFQLALRMRANGLSSLAQTLPQALRGENQAQASKLLANGMKRFLASDVVYADEYAQVAAAKIREEGIDKVEVATNQVFLAGTNEQYAYTTGAQALIKQMKNGSASTAANSGTLRGTSVEGVSATPSGTTLSTDGTTSIVGSGELGWEVEVKNGGEVDEQNIEVTVSLTYGGATPAYTKTATIANLAKGETTTVTVPGPTASEITNDQEGSLLVETSSVPGERNTDNNSKDYLVKITFG